MSLCVHRFGIECNRRHVLEGSRRPFGPSDPLSSNDGPLFKCFEIYFLITEKMESTEGFLKREVMA